MNRIFRVCLGFVALALSGLALSGCNPSNAGVMPRSSDPATEGRLTGRLTLTGSSTVAPLISEIAQRFEGLHPDVRIDVQTGGSSRGIRDAHRGAADVGMSSRHLKPEEEAGVESRILAWDGVAFVVHQNNPITELTRKQLVAIYTGAVDNWHEVGGRDRPIIVSNRAEGRSELDLMTAYLDVESTQIAADVIDGETQQTIKTITTNTNAITYTSIGAAQHSAEYGAPLRLLPLDGVAASTTAVQSGDFPLARPLILIQRTDEPNALLNAFLDYALSADVDDLTESLGYVPPNR